MRVALLTTAVLVAAITSVTSPRAANALTPQEIACGDAVLESSQDFVSDKLKALVDCHNGHGGCNEAKRDRQITKATARLTRALNRVCRGVTLENLGFPGSCPASGGAFTTDELGACLATELESFVDAAIALAIPGDGTDLSGDDAQCQNVIAGETRLFINRKLRARTRCLDLQLKGKLSTDVNCLAEVPPGTGNRDTDQLIAKAFKLLDDKLRRGCRGADLTALGFPGSCPTQDDSFSVGDLQNCLGTSLESATDALVALLVPFTNPLPTATETPLATPTAEATGEPTPEETPSAGPTGEPTATPVETGEPTPIETATAGPTGEATATASPPETGEPTPTASAEPTVEPTATEEPTEEPTPTETETPGPVATSTPSGVACPSQITFLGSGEAADLDTGWTGLSHDSKVITNGLITADLSACDNEVEPCGVCTLTGPVPNAGLTTAMNPSNNRRCTADTSVPCSSDGDCTGLGTCQFFFGAPLPLSSGGVSVCVVNQVNGPLTGTVDTASGDSTSTTILLSHVFTGPTVDQPCPVCGSGGFGTSSTCSSGQNSGAPCIVNGTSSLFGSTSFDCPPLPGANVGNLTIPLSLSTGLQTRTLSADNPDCSAAGATSAKCFCDTCADAGAEACSTNADCPGGATCGAKRCITGPNAGTLCTAPSECPMSACSRPGFATAPNQCDDSTCTPDASDTDSINEGTCANGPFELFCAIQTFRGCSDDSDCTAPGDSCTNGKFRECFTDNGVVGNAVQVQGMPESVRRRRIERHPGHVLLRGANDRAGRQQRRRAARSRPSHASRYRHSAALTSPSSCGDARSRIVTLRERAHHHAKLRVRRSWMARRPLSCRKRVPVPVKWGCAITGSAALAQPSPIQRNHPSRS